MLIAFRKTVRVFQFFIFGDKINNHFLPSWVSGQIVWVQQGPAMAVLAIKMQCRPDFNNVSVEFAAVPSFLCGQMSWFLFGLGRRMFEENLYDAIPSVIELFLSNSLSFRSLAVEGSVFLLFKPWRCWHQ